MNIKSSLLIILIFLSPVISQAQELNDKVLMTVNGKKIQAGEFIRMYNKSKEPGKSLDTDEYLQQFIVFKLKVAEAMEEGYDTTKAFKTELKGYRNQLSQNYLTDTKTKESLLKKALSKIINRN